MALKLEFLEKEAFSNFFVFFLFFNCLKIQGFKLYSNKFYSSKDTQKHHFLGQRIVKRPIFFGKNFVMEPFIGFPNSKIFFFLQFFIFLNKRLLWNLSNFFYRSFYEKKQRKKNFNDLGKKKLNLFFQIKKEITIFFIKFYIKKLYNSGFYKKAKSYCSHNKHDRKLILGVFKTKKKKPARYDPFFFFKKKISTTKIINFRTEYESYI
mmetsp:Transcript_6341/g.16003  ORF Transcript_6341/g.16003 Transcript_6341/m.16003 type:complete len:208 (-) Transcript_6341:1049-1672(-)